MTGTHGGRLGTPDDWIEEVASGLLAHTPEPEPLSFALTYRAGLPDRIPAGASVDDVVADLEAGFVSKCRGGRDGDYYVLYASRFNVFVHAELTRSGEVPLAVISKVEQRRSLPASGPVVYAQVSAHPPYDEEWCDIASVHDLAQEWVRYARAWERAWDRSSQLLARPGRNADSHADLHARVRRHFGALEQMITLLQQRSETEGTVRAHGVVTGRADGRDDVLAVQLTRRDSGFGDEENVEVTVPGQRKPMRLALVAIEGDEAWISMPDTPRAQELLTPGARVELACTPRFGLKRHGYALSRLLREEVEGDWESLARLVSDPGSLPTPAPFGTLPWYFDDNLNPEQRAAVAGAVLTPHAYFIQGPPGTGKTTVICEIIRQLTARGERVLLLAPMHVAVDEALQRVGDADGVLALRASYDDSKVREELRKFTKSRITAEFVRKARTPRTARSGQWHAEAAALRGERELIETVIATGQELARAEQAAAAARRDRADAQSAHQTAFAQAADDAKDAARALADMESRLSEADQWARAAAQALAAAEARGTTLVQRLLASVGAGELARLRQEDAQAKSRRDAAAEQVRMASESHARLAAALGQLRQRGAELAARHAADEARAASAMATVRERLASAYRTLRTAGIAAFLDDVSDPPRLAELAELAARRERREARLTQLAHLEGRWFQLTGLAGLGEGDQDGQRKVVTDLGDSLVGAANVVCCTTTGFGGDSTIRDADFDTLIVDEASRVIDSEFLIGARQARRWVLVGDEHQLPPHVNPADEHHLHALAALHMTERAAADDLDAAVSHLAKLWREDEEVHQFRTSSVTGLAASLSESGLWREIYAAEYQKAYDRLRADGADAERGLLRKMRHHLVQSVFERCVAEGPEELRGPLVEQHRMIDAIAALVREPVYKGNYVTPPDERLRVTPLTTSRTFPEPVVFLDTSRYPGSRETQEGSGCFNELEARLVADTCRAWDRELAAQGERDVTVSVLSFYKAQARRIRQRLGAPRFKEFRVLRFRDIDSIDRLQGQESDLIIISFCRASPRQHLWLQDVRRLNVACTRAKRGIVLVGHKNTLADLRGIPAAEQFYAHMFGLFARRAPGTVLLNYLDGTGQ